MFPDSIQTHQSTCTSGDWQWYLGSVKHIIQTTGLDQIVDQSEDLAILLDWVHYNDVHARFCRQYWHREIPSYTPPPPACSAKPLSPPITENSSAGVILTHLLSEVIDAVSTQPPLTSPAGDISNYNQFLQILDWRIRNVPIPNEDGEDTDGPLILELYQLAIQIYLDRACKTQFSPRTKTHKHVQRAFEIIPRLQACDRQFPIFIIGCEARDDEQRAMVLDLIGRTRNGVSSRAFIHTPLLIQAMWAQEDLAGGDPVDYGERLASVISCCRIMPTFV
jgi:hypothetical protein